MKFFWTLLLLCSFSTQAQINLTGTVQDDAKKSVAYATISLFKAVDSTFYKSAWTDDAGIFVIKDVATGDYVLNISGIGYGTLSRKLTLSTNTTLDNLILVQQKESLDVVTVNAKKPIVEKRADRIIFNVENSTLSNGNAATILKSTPGVVTINGNYLVQNKAAVVYINNKRVYLTSDELNQLLSGYSANNITTVEVITVPPAQYDADGAAIININTSKGISLGYKGSLTADYTIDTFAKYQLGTSHFYKNNWLNVYANYNYNPRKDYKEDESQIGFFNTDGTRNSRWFIDFDKVSRSAAHNFNTVIDITVDSNNTIDISGNFVSNKNQEIDSRANTLILNQGATTFSGFNTASNLGGQRTQGFANAGWDHYFKNKSKLRLEGNYIFTDRDVSQDLNSRFFDTSNTTTGTNSFSTVQDQLIKIYATSLDYNFTLSTWEMAAGIKSTAVENTSILDFFDRNSGSNVFDNALSDNFFYKENVQAAFLQANRDWETISLTAGLRVEQTDITGTSRALGTVNTQSYLELFPSVSLSKQMSEDNTYVLSYKRSLERPKYESLNPFSYFINDNNFITGNPNLTPAFTSAYAASWIHKDFFNLDVRYGYTDNLLAQMPFQDNTNFTLNSQTVNLNYELQYSLDGTFYKYINSSWYNQTYVSLFYIENEFTARASGNVTQQLNTTGFYLNTFNRFNLSTDKTLSMDAQAGYLSSLLVGSYLFENQLTSSVGLRKTIWNKRGIITVNFNDLFLGQNQRLTSRYLNQDNYYLGLPETQTFNVGFTYNFGNYGLDNRAVETPEEQKRTQTNTF